MLLVVEIVFASPVVLVFVDFLSFLRFSSFFFFFFLFISLSCDHFNLKLSPFIAQKQSFSCFSL